MQCSLTAFSWILVLSYHSGTAGDWLLQRPSDYPPAVVHQQAVADSVLTLGNTLVERSFTTTPDFACVSFRSLLTAPPTEILRAVGPEALVTLDGVAYHIGGLVLPPNVTGANCSATHCPDAARRGIFTDPATLQTLRRNDSSWHYVSHTIDTELTKHFEWTPGTRHSPTDVSWPPKGTALHVCFEAPASSPTLHKKLQVTVHYEITQGAPIVTKWLTVSPRPGVPPAAVAGVVISGVHVEFLSVTQPYSPLALSTYPFYRSLLPNPWRHGWDGNAPFDGLLWVEMDQGHSASINWQDDLRVAPTCSQCQGGIAPGAGEPVLNVSYNDRDASIFQDFTNSYRFRLALDPSLPGTENATFTSMRALELVLDVAGDHERTGMAVKRMKRLLAPAIQENPIFMASPQILAIALMRVMLTTLH